MKKILMALMAMIAITSCENNDFENLQQNAGGIKLVLQAEGFDQLNTRAVTEGQVNDITILEFQGGTLAKILYYDNQDFLSKPLTIADGSLVSIPAATMKKEPDVNNGEKEILDENGSENLVCVLANLGSATATGLTEGTSKFADFTRLSLTFDKDGEVLPMCGYYYGGITDGVTDQINVSLTRSVAKINFTLNTANFKVTTKDGEKEVTETPSVTVNSIKLINAPVKYSPYACYNRPAIPQGNLPGVWPATQSPFPVFTADSYASTFTEYAADQNNATDKTKGYVAYMPENVRGSYGDDKIANQKEKHPGKILNSDEWKTNDNHGYTYILVDLDYTLASGIVQKATYKIFLGGDNKGDMNLLRGYQYNITTNIYGANIADSRIDVSSVFDPETGRGGDDNGKIKGVANSYIINPTTPASDIEFVIPLAQVRFGWDAIKAALSNDDPDKKLDIHNKIVNRTASSFSVEWLETYDGAPTITFSEPAITFDGKPTDMSKYFIKVKIPSTVKAGHNAIIKMKDGEDVLWSWHLWITDYNPDAEITFDKDTYTYTVTNGQVHRYYGDAFNDAITSKYYGKVMMDRNLGATATGVTGAIDQPTTNDAAKTYVGLYYQFGRKDPFAAVAEGVIASKNGPVTYATATKNPSTFYLFAGDWNDNGGVNIDSWNGNVETKSVFDPCPEGWRVPNGGTKAAENVWAGFSTNDDPDALDKGGGAGVFEPKSSVGSQSDTQGRMYSKDGVQAWYPYTGNINASGELSSWGVNGYCWSASTYNAESGYCLRYFADNAAGVMPTNTNNRALGRPVRCIKE